MREKHANEEGHDEKEDQNDDAEKDVGEVTWAQVEHRVYEQQHIEATQRVQKDRLEITAVEAHELDYHDVKDVVAVIVKACGVSVAVRNNVDQYIGVIKPVSNVTFPVAQYAQDGHHNYMDLHSDSHGWLNLFKVSIVGAQALLSRLGDDLILGHQPIVDRLINILQAVYVFAKFRLLKPGAGFGGHGKQSHGDGCRVDEPGPHLKHPQQLRVSLRLHTCLYGEQSILDESFEALTTLLASATTSFFVLFKSF